MRPFTLRSDVVTKDKSTKQVDKITKSYMKMTKTISKESKVADSAFRRLTNGISTKSKRALVSMNNLNASVNRTFRSMSKRLGSLGVFVGFSAAIMAVKKSIGIFADFEQANAGLAAVMGKTVGENSKLIEDSKRLGSITAKTSTEVVGLQEAFARLGFQEKAILNMTETTISGSIAMRGELSDTAEMVGAMVSTFDDFSSIDAPKIIDQLTSATQKSALNFEKLQTALPNVAGAANKANIPFHTMLALLGKLSDAGIDASASSTALRNIILRSAKAGKNYKQILGDIVKNQDQLTSSMDEFGIRAAVPATILAGKLNETLTLSNDILNDNGSASIAAAKQLDTLKGRLTLLGSAYEGFILSLDDGTGAMSGFLKQVVEVATEVLALASGTEKLETELNKAEKRTRKIAKTVRFLLKVVKLLVVAYIAFKAILLASKIAMAAYNIVVGIQAALYGTLTRGIIANNIALGAYTVVSKLATAAQWLLNGATYAFPGVWLLAAIAAIVAGIIYMATHWKEITKSMVDDWNRVKTTFKKDGFGGLFKMWGQDLQIYLLEPLQNLLAILYKLTGGEGWKDLMDQVIKSRNKLLVEAGRGDERLIKKMSRNNFDYGANIPSEVLFGNKSFAPDVVPSKDNLINALDKNSEELDKNTKAGMDGWTGRFSTSILRDANISERTSGIVQRELATTAINNEENVINNQKEVVTSAVSTPTKSRRSNNVNGTINVIVENRTGGGIGVEFEGTGINVMTTGND